MLTQEIKISKTRHSRIHEMDEENLGFGSSVSDHMVICDYANGEWQTPQLVPYANLSLSPTTLALHYGQTVFEGMKAFRTVDDKINIFRLDKHQERFNRSLDRMCMAEVPKELFEESLLQLISTDRQWVPRKAGSALYIRPFMFASEQRFGVKISEEYRLVIFTGPVGPYYAQPLCVKIETDYIRAAKGGTGFAKCGGNYGAAFYPTKKARLEGYDQVIWTDSFSNEFIEESGTMNIIFVIDGKLVTPPLSDSILDGITRDSLITMARSMDIEVEERPVSINELIESADANLLTEAFGAGTAAVVAPIRRINAKGIDINLAAYNDFSMHSRLKQKLEDIRTGAAEDLFGWNLII